LKHSMYFEPVNKIGLQSCLLLMHICLYGPKNTSICITKCVRSRNVGEVTHKNVIFLSSGIHNEMLKVHLLYSIYLSFYTQVTPGESSGRLFIKFQMGTLTNIC
jgi:hypothetical protein